MEESIEKNPEKTQSFLGPRLPNAHRSLEIGDVRLKFQFKKLRFVSSVIYEVNV
jgi:hypothetical protein